MADLQFIKSYPAMDRHRAEMAALRRQRRRRLGAGLTIASVLTGFALWLSPPLALLVAGVAGMILFFSSIGASSSVPADQLVGIEGELRTLETLKQLPDECTLFNRVMLPDEWLPNGQRELDFIVIAPNGLFVIEVKNTPGRIHVDPDARHWPLVGRGCGGRPDWQAVANPLPQVRAQAAALERWLLRHGQNEPIHSVVCFSRPEVILENTSASPIPVVVPEQLLELIGQLPDRVALEPEHRARLRAVISGIGQARAARAA